MQILCFQSADIPRYKNCFQRTKRLEIAAGIYKLLSVRYASLLVMRGVVIRHGGMKVRSEAYFKNSNSINFLAHFYFLSRFHLLRSICLSLQVICRF